MPNYGEGLYRIFNDGANAVTDIEYRLQQNGTGVATQSYTITNEIGFATGIQFPVKTIENVTGQFNELRVRVASDPGQVGGFEFSQGFVRVFPLAQFDSPGGNNVEVQAANIVFPTADREGRRYAEGGLSNSSNFQHRVHLRSGTTRIDQVTVTGGFAVDSFSSVQANQNFVFDNTSLGANSGIDNAEVEISYNSSAFATAFGSSAQQGVFPTGPFDYNEGFTITITSQTAEWHSP